jgi:hypothetical protein
MFLVDEADVAAIRVLFNEQGELSAAIELHRRFPGIADNAEARELAVTIADWKPLPAVACQIIPLRPRSVAPSRPSRDQEPIQTIARAKWPNSRLGRGFSTKLIVVDSTQPEELLFTVAVCQAEILSGSEILPDGRRRRVRSGSHADGPTRRPLLHELITHSPALRAFNAATDPLRRSETPG